MLGDFGGGAMLLALGVTAAVLEARTSGRGQVVDAAIVDGTALLAAMFFGWEAEGTVLGARGTNLLDGGCHYYQPYRCRDGRWIAVGAIEPQFYAEFLAGLGVAGDPEYLAGHEDRSRWAALTARTAAIIGTRTRAEWLAVFDGTDACVSPVLDLDEVAAHPHNRARNLLVEIDGVPQPAPAPRFSRTVPDRPSRPGHPAEHTREALAGWGVPADRLDALMATGVVRQAETAAQDP
jgi:alpha-methylacyl-CoA racemase